MKRFSILSASLGLAVAGTAVGEDFTLRLLPLGAFETDVFDEAAAEINAFDPVTSRLFVTNSDSDTIDVLDASNPDSPSLIDTISLAKYGDGIQSVDVDAASRLLAAAVGASVETDPGTIVLVNLDDGTTTTHPAGALPDMITFSPDGGLVVTADEGQPNDEYTIDPPGGITILDVAKGTSTTFTFEGIDPSIVGDDIVLSSPEGTTFAQAMEPEYVAFSADGSTLFVALQENNAFAKFDVANREWMWVRSMGFKDHSLLENRLDASNRDDAINIAQWPISGIYMPDAIATFEVDGATFIATANEGDSRDYDGYSNEVRVGSLTLDPAAFPDADFLQQSRNLGRIRVDASLGDTDGDGDYDALFSFGARSMSIFDDEGNLVADTGDLMESVTASVLGENFNSTNDENDSFDNRSDDKGPEPEGITIGYLNLGRPVAFVGLERIGGIMAFDLSDPTEPAFLTYINTRDFSGDAEAGTAGDLAPEGLTFIAASESPTGTPLLAVSFEVSGSTRFFEIESGFGEEICNDPGPDSFTADGFEGLEQGGVACYSSADDFTLDNAWARVYNASQIGSERFDVSCLDVGIRNAGGYCDAILNLHRCSVFSSTGAPLELELIASEPFGIQPILDGDLAFQTVSFDTPVEVDLSDGSSLVVEMQLPFQPSGFTSFAGSSATTYGTTFIRSETCGIPEYLTLADIGFPGFEWHLTVNGWAGEAPRCNADLDGDGDVDSADLGILLGHWGPCSLPRTCLGDLNGDGAVASADLGMLLSAYGPCP
ncbi:MAG: hypothetical protein CBB69_007225 [Phycisphaera sp. TMED9]|nr:MAG: hypothetical protein CBB69_007225 [Phycisphaera sp. TMED9]